MRTYMDIINKTNITVHNNVHKIDKEHGLTQGLLTAYFLSLPPSQRFPFPIE